MVKPKLSKVAKKLRPNNEDYFDNSVSGPALRDDSAKPRKEGTNHKTWRQLKDMGTSDAIATRDVHNTQRLERGDMDEIKSGTGMKVLAAMAGILSFVLLWLAWGLVGFGATFVSDKATDKTYGMDWGAAFDLPPYYQEHEIPPEPGSGLSSGEKCYTPLDEAGNPIGDCVAGEDFVTPEWYDKAVKEQQEAHGLSDKDVAKIEKKHEYVGLGGWLGFRKAGYFRWLLTLAGAAGIWGATRTALLRTVKAQNFMADNTDINQYKNDQHIAVPMEVAERYQVFPDVGAHSPVQVSSMISHVMLSNKGIKNVTRAKRVEQDILDEDGEIITHKGEILYDDNGNEVLEELPMFDTDFGHGLYSASGIPKVKRLRKFFNPKEISSNPGGEIFDKFGDADTVADHVNKYWEYPSYEPQRPAGVYIVDEAPVNTMVLAITRAGKGQTYIEPMIDMWLREINHNNMVVNDPKGELLVKHYVRATIRGFKVVQFNLINALKTDIYNPLALAAESAREGDFKACATYVENIGEVFFPVDGADDPVWPNAANNAFKRTAYGIIDYYLEEEREMRKHAMLEDKDLKALETELDQMWGKVTLYNCYQFFVQLSAKKLKDPKVRFQEENKNLSPEEQSAIPDSKFEELEREAELWKGEQEVDMLTLFFNATDALPLNSMRTQVGNADKALRSMGGAEKMLASCDSLSTENHKVLLAV